MWWFLLLKLVAAEPENDMTPEPSSEVIGEDEDAPVPSDESEQPLSEEQRQENLRQLWSSMSDEDLTEQVFARQSSGKYDSAQEILDFLVDRNDVPYYSFLWAQNHEFMELYPVALAEYEDLLSLDLLPDLELNVRFRKAIVLDDMGFSREAVTAFRRLRRGKKLLGEGDLEKVNLLLGAALIHSGKHRCGTRLINKILPLVEADAAWYQARARHALIDVLIHSAEKKVIRGGAKTKLLVASRLQIMSAAEQQLGAIVQLYESEFILSGIISIVDAYLRFYDDVVTVPPPQEYTFQRAKIYELALLEKAEVIRRKALSFSSKGVNYAKRVGWDGEALQELTARRDALQKAIQQR